jgi:hypothetical protein
MRKQQPEKKKYLLRRAKKVERNKRKRKDKKYFVKFNLPVHNRYQEKPPKFVDIVAPISFSLREVDCVNSINFINDVKKLSSGNKNVNILLDKVEYIGEGAIALLLSVINDCNTNGTLVKGNKPKNADARRKLDRSGFFNYLRTLLSEEDLKTKNTFLRKGTETTPSSSIAKEVHKAMETVWGVKARCPILTGGVIEMIRNSCDHAFWEKESITWYFGLSHYEDLSHVKFADYQNSKRRVAKNGY